MKSNLRRLLVTSSALFCLSAFPAQADPITAAITAVSAFASTAVGAFVLNAAGSVLLSYATNALLGQKPQKAALQERQAAILELSLGVTPRQAVLGTAATGGSLLYAYNWGPDYEQEAAIILLADHEIDDLVGFYIGDKFYPWSGSGYQAGFQDTESFNHTQECLEIQLMKGSADQAVPQVIVDTAGGEWTADDRVSGCAWVWVTAHVSDQVWAGVRPIQQMRFVVRGAKLYNPARDSTVPGGLGSHRWGSPETYEHSDNAAVCRYNYHRGIWTNGQLVVGPGRSAEEAPPEDVIADINLCDERVLRKDGFDEPRYFVGCVIDASEPWIDADRKFAAAMGGDLVPRNGALAVDPGAAKTELTPFTDGDLIRDEPITVSRFLPRDQLVNTVAASFIDPDQLFEPTPSPIRRAAEDLAADGETRELPLALDYVTSRTQAQRIAEIARRKARLQRRAQVTLGPRFMPLEVGDWVEWTSELYHNGAARIYRVDAVAHDEKLRTHLRLSEIAASVYDWDAETDELDAEIPAYTPPSAPPAASLANFNAEMIEIPGEAGARPVAIRATWTPPTDTSIKSIRLEYRVADSPTIMTETADWPASGAKLITTGVVDFVNYEVRATPLPDPGREAVTTGWEPVSSLNLLPAPPPDVSFFDVYPGEDNLRFVWSPVSYGAAVDYEIRQGDSWNEGNVLTRQSSDTVTIKKPAATVGDATYWIKAVTRIGDVYSVTPRFTTARQAPLATRNVLAEEDFAAADWPGVAHDLILDGVSPEKYLKIASIGGVRAAFGDYYQVIDVGARVYARTWAEGRAARTAGASPLISSLAGIKVGDLSPMKCGVPLAATDAANVVTYIAEDIPAADFVAGARLAGNANDTTGSPAADARGLAYQAAHFATGLKSDSATGAAWSFSVPSTNTCLLTLRPYEAITAEVIFLRLNDADSWLELGYDHAGGKLYAEDNNAVRLELAAPVWAVGEVYQLALVQSATQRRLFWASRRDQTPRTASLDVAAVGAFTRVRVAGGAQTLSDYGDAVLNDYSGQTLSQLATAAKKARAIFADLEIRSTAMDVQTFANSLMRGPAGFATFRRLAPGDYDFKLAAIWQRLKTEGGVGDQLALTGGRIWVDVPDVVDSGDANIEIGGTFVTYSREFNAIPKPVATQVEGAGAVANVRILSRTLTGFQCALYDRATGASVAGAISWSAVGY